MLSVTTKHTSSSSTDQSGRKRRVAGMFSTMWRDLISALGKANQMVGLAAARRRDRPAAIPKLPEAVQTLVMRAGIVVNVTPEDRRRLEAIIGDRNAPQKHVWRAKIILATADGCGTSEIMRRSGKAKPVVWRWQARFMAEGVAGLTRDKTTQTRQAAATGRHGAAGG
jgi:hypothetical protein